MPVYEAEYDVESTLDLKDMLRILRKRRTMILVIFLFALLGSSIISLFLPKIYQAETTLRVKQGKSLGASLLAELPIGNPLETKQLMSTYAEIIKSRTVISEVIKLIGEKGAGKHNYESLLGQIEISPVRDTEILKVQIRAASPKEAQLIANTVVAVFLKRLSELAQSEQSTIKKFIAERLVESKLELAQAENTLKNYKSREKIVAPDDENKALVTQMAELNKLIAENKIELSTGAARVELANQQLANEKPGFVAETPLVQQCKSKLIELEVELVDLAHKYTENHPQVMAVRAAIAEVKGKLNEEIDRAVHMDAVSLNPIHQGILKEKLEAEAGLAAATAQKTALDAIVQHSEAVLVKLPAKEEGLVRVMRNSQLAQEIYIMLAKRYEEARISEAMQPTNVQVLDRALLPDPGKPIAPNRKLNVAIGSFFGLLFGVGLALLLEFINKTITAAEDVERYLDLPVLGNIPVFNMKSNISVHTDSFWKRFILKNKAEG